MAMRYFIATALIYFGSALALQAAEDSRAQEPPEIRAWRDYIKQIEASGIEALTTYPQPTALDRAEGLRYLLQQLGSSAEQQLLRQPGQIPLLRIGATTINKWGMDGADAKYQGATISGNAAYRFSGQLGSARLFAMQLTRMAGTYQAYGALTGEQLGADAEGNFEVILSAKKPGDWQGVWLPLNPEVDSVLVREYFGNWESERPGRYYLEQIDSDKKSVAVTTPDMTALLNDSAKAFAARVPQWQGRVEQAKNHLVNQVYVGKPDGQGLSTNYYGSGWFKVAAGEALIIELDKPEARLWSVQLGNVWWESIDYINHTASYNDSQAIAGSDGKYRFVLSQVDPGVPNWLDPAGHSEGAILFRMQVASKVVQPVTKLVSLKDLAKNLPDDTPRVLPEQRESDIAVRRRHAAVRWAP